MPKPIAIFVDRGFDIAPFAAALEPALDCRESVDASEADAVAAVVTGAVPIGAAEVAPYPGLRLVLTCSIGTDHLDLAALSQRGITVCNTPTYCTDEVADHALACVLAGWRGLWRLGNDVRGGGWDYAAGGTLRRFDRSRLGIVGLGRIGRALALKARAIGVDVVAFDPYVESAAVPLVALEELLRTCDAVSLHAPAAPGAGPLLGAAELALMPAHAVLVNMARPEVVDLDAVVAALRGGRLAAAAWDVWPKEPPAAGDTRLATPGLIVTPHAAWFSEQAEAAYVDEGVAALRALLLDGAEPAGRVV